MPSRKSIAAFASFSSIFDSAKPTWISTQSPGLTSSPSSRPMLIARLTPLTSTLARSGRSARISMTSPGMPRHMSASCLSSCEQFERGVDGGADRLCDWRAQLHPMIEYGRLAADQQDSARTLAEQSDQAEDDVRLHPVRVEQFGRGRGRRVELDHADGAGRL